MGYCSVIRRPAISPQPTGAAALPLPDLESPNPSDAARPQKKRKRQPGGLGRGLGRILTDSGNEGGSVSVQRSGLLRLVGGDGGIGSTRIRDVLVEAALGAMSAGFGLDGVVLAVQAGPTTPGEEIDSQETEPASPSGGPSPSAGSRDTFLAAKLPPSWTADSEPLFQLYGNLWWLLEDPERLELERQEQTPPWAVSAPNNDVDDQPGRGERIGSNPDARQWQLPLGQGWLWLCRLVDGEDVVAAVALRPSRFEAVEADTLASLVHATVLACSSSEARATQRERIVDGTTTTLKTDGDDIQAEVVAEWHRPVERPSRRKPVDGRTDTKRVGVARATDIPTAVAKAAAKACRPRCQVTFAGSSEVDDESDVSIVMIDGPEHGLRMGFAVRRRGDHGGPAEAVFTAAVG